VKAPFLVGAAVALVSALVSFAFSIAAVQASAGLERSVAVYACARSTAFAVIATAPFFNSSIPWLRRRPGG
jgi:hypothetical protein